MTDFYRWLILIGVVLLGALLYVLSPVLTPFMIAALLAYLFNPLVDKFESWRIPRIIGVTLTFALIIFVIWSLIFFLIPILEKQINILIDWLPTFINWIQQTVLPWINTKFHLNDQNSLASLKDTITQDIMNNWQTSGGAAKILGATIFKSGKAIILFVTNIILIPLVIFYLLRDWQTVTDGCVHLIPEGSRPRIVALLNECGDVLSAFFRGQFLVMIGVGIWYSIGLWLIGLDMALLIGVISGILNIVPYLGFFIGLIASIAAVLIQYHDLTHFLLVLLLFGLGAIMENFILVPWLIGDRIGLHPVVVIFAVLAGGHLYGIIGVLIALPVAAVIVIFLRHLQVHYRNSKAYKSTHLEVDPLSKQ